MWRRKIRLVRETPGKTAGARGVPCRDERGRRVRLTVTLAGDRVLLDRRFSLTLLEAGRLRAALREVVRDETDAE